MRRRALVAGLAGLDHAMTMTKIVQDAGVPASLWMGGVGTIPGSVAWTVPVGSVAEWAGHSERLLGSDDYRAAATEGRELFLEFEPDELMQLVHGEIDSPAEIGHHLTSIQATVNPDRTAEATAFAPTIAAAWSDVTGIPALVLTNAAGPMDVVTWAARHDDAASIDAANEEIMASETYAGALAAGDGLFTGGVQSFARRVA